jgi:hypothetical protein
MVGLGVGRELCGKVGVLVGCTVGCDLCYPYLCMVHTLGTRYLSYSRWVGRYLTNRTPVLLLGRVA